MNERTSKPSGGASGQAGQKSEKSKFRMESQQERAARAKLRMEKRWDKLGTTREKLENQKPPKKRGPVRRVGGAAGQGIHGFVHGKIYEVEHENVGTEGAHRSELMGEAVGGRTVRFVKKRVRTHPARAAARAVDVVRRHPVGALALIACVLLLVVMQSCMSSLVSVGNGTVGAVAASTYPCEDADMLGAEADYCALEAELQHYLDTYTSTHDYDEYHFDLDDIEHDPYVLISMLCALNEGAWTLDEVQNTLQTLFDRQYILTENVVVEQRYYIETDTWTDEDGNTHSDSYRVYYDYYICDVTLENFDLSHLPVYIMGQDQMSRYALFMATLGNRPDLFPTSSYVSKYITGGPTLHEVPESYLSDETFAALLTEAEKYIGYPYVWGGSSPSTSFDCSGYLSYVLNQCGWNVGRLGAQGLYNYCTPTSSPQPGDLVFFVGTYDTPGVSHCGLYVGDGWMLHCGDPVGYANLNSSYWQSHLYAYGRLP